MSSLRKLDLSEHPEFFWDEADEQIEKQKSTVGLPQSQKGEVAFQFRKLTF